MNPESNLVDDKQLELLGVSTSDFSVPCFVRGTRGKLLRAKKLARSITQSPDMVLVMRVGGTRWGPMCIARWVPAGSIVSAAEAQAIKKERSKRNVYQWRAKRKAILEQILA